MEIGLYGLLGQLAVYLVDKAFKPILEIAAIHSLPMVAKIVQEMQQNPQVVTIKLAL